MAQTVQQPLVGQLSRYEGVYCPHWESGHIAVRVPREWKWLAWKLAALGLLLALGLRFLQPGAAWVCVATGVAAVSVLLPARERWTPRFPPDFLGGLEEGLELVGGPIEFEGIVTAPGRYGHKGCMCREVEIVRVLRYRVRRSPRRIGKRPAPSPSRERP